MPNDKTHILVIEDDQFLRDLITKKLETEGFEVEAAIDGQAGLERAVQNPPQLILLDIILPVLDGFEVLKQIRGHADKKVAGTPIVLLSNLGQESDVEKGKAMGANDYLIKAAFTTDEIVAKIKKVLGG